MNEIRTKILQEAGLVYREKKTLTDSILTALNFAFPGGPLLHALDLVEKEKVSELTAPSGRSVFQVIGSSGTPYICLLTSGYCGCPAFRYCVLKRGEYPYCKHILAILLSKEFELVKMQQISEDELSTVIETMD